MWVTAFLSQLIDWKHKSTDSEGLGYMECRESTYWVLIYYRQCCITAELEANFGPLKMDLLGCLRPSNFATKAALRKFPYSHKQLDLVPTRSSLNSFHQPGFSYCQEEMSTE